MHNLICENKEVLEKIMHIILSEQGFREIYQEEFKIANTQKSLHELYASVCRKTFDSKNLKDVLSNLLSRGDVTILYMVDEKEILIQWCGMTGGLIKSTTGWNLHT